MNVMTADHDDATSKTLSLLVRQVRFEAVGINSYELVHADGHALPYAEAGSHLDIHLPGGLIRQYSICNDPAERFHYIIAVLNDEKGRGGSRLLHELVQVSNVLATSRPRNNFSLARDGRHHILIAGGIGITPLKAMVHELVSQDVDYELHYCAKAPEHAAFHQELAGLGDTVRFHYDSGDPANGMDISGLLKTHDAGTHLYYCGPGGFMGACAAASAHWPAGTVHSEYFKAPAEPAPVPDNIDSDSTDNFIIQIASTGIELDVPADRSIVEVLHEAGIDLDTSCVSGLCGTCKVKYLSGTVEHRDFILSEDEKVDHLTACVSRATSQKLVLDL
ncbi:MAG: PDR/VanB family oxidoreductase [Janthinobacterium lividum]